jgi:PilZ domain
MKSTVREVMCSEPRVDVVARAVCGFENGEIRDLFATRFSLVGISILSLRPPSIGSVFSVSLHPFGLHSLPSMKAVVVSTRLDPANANKSGFEALFTSLSDDQIEALFQTASTLGLPCALPKARPSVERRRDPRVQTNLDVYVDISGRRLQAAVENMSMSGALLSFSKEDGFFDINIGELLGAVVEIEIIGQGIPEFLSVEAEVVRLVDEGKGINVGLRFVNIDESAALRIEGLILHALRKT